MTNFPLLAAFASYWWVLLLRGIIAALFGFLAFVMPGLTLVALVLLYGAYALVDGVTALFVGGRARAWWLVFAGVLGLVAGVLTFIFPAITAFWLLILIASWAIVRGIFEIVAAIQLRKELTNEWMLILGGVLSIIFGILLLLNPAAGALAMVWLIGSYALVFGMMMIVLSFRLRGLRKFKPVTV
ncbi:HdeD family acid-resistance protein [candidate division KSB1 bacterium]|nr:HdeD family acid-resistance protein [candidate division KSB1 bacterium]